MLTAAELGFLVNASLQAKRAGHLWPDYAACEAALESAYGSSALARDANNLFGMKQHRHAVYGTMYLPTKEFINSDWIIVEDRWVKYPSIAACFFDRMQTLQRLASVYPNYLAALASRDGAGFVTFVSKTWATDPQRGDKVLAIHNEWQSALSAQPSAIAQADGDPASSQQPATTRDASSGGQA